jgi:signal transduction histidine kinase
VTRPLRNPVIGYSLVRIAQEAVTNAPRHGACQKVTVSVEQRAKTLRLEIEDDGRGMARIAARRRGVGLETMRFRAGTIGATLRRSARVPHGLLASGDLPLPALALRSVARRAGPVVPLARARSGVPNS